MHTGEVVGTILQELIPKLIEIVAAVSDSILSMAAEKMAKKYEESSNKSVGKIKNVVYNTKIGR